jgi:hypothetical protein
VPPTDAVAGEATPPQPNAWRLVLLALAGMLATVLVLTPAKRRA